MRELVPRFRRPLLVLTACAVCLLPAPHDVHASPFGVNAHVPPAVVVDEIAAADIAWVRIDFLWSRVETEPDRYDWRVYDSLMDRLEASDLRVFATLQGTPAWATDGSEFSGVPRDTAHWQEFVYRAAFRYRGRIEAWGLWNEPNLPRFWQGTRDQYIDLILRPGAMAIRAADPQALVCGPDLAHLSSADWDGWLRAVIREAGNLLDVVTHHVYPSGGLAVEVFYDLDGQPSWLQGSPSVREVLQDSGWWGRPFWLTETGVESRRVGWAAQAAFVDNLFDQWFGPSPRARWLDRVFLYQIHDPPAPDTSTFGLLTAWPELDRKLAYGAFAEVIRTAAFDSGSLVETPAPSFVAPGATAEIAFTLRNDGTTTWRGAAGYSLDVSSDRVAWRVLEHRLPTDFEVGPGEEATAVVPVQAPWILTDGNRQVTVRARLVAPDGRRFGDPISAVITASSHAPARIEAQPAAVIAAPGGSVRLRISVISDTPVTYRWRRDSIEIADGDRISGSDGPHLQLSAVDASLTGRYDCLITNAAGTVVSESASVDLGAPKPRTTTGRSRPVAPSLSLVGR